MAQVKEVIENAVLVANRQHEDGNVSCYLRGDNEGLSVKVASSQIPSTRIITASGKTVTVPTAIAKGTPLYCEIGMLTTLVDSKGAVIGSHRNFQGLLALEPVASHAAHAAPTVSADLPEDEEI